MISEEAVSYARTLLAAGHSQTEIGDILLQAGWQPYQVEQLFAQLDVLPNTEPPSDFSVSPDNQEHSYRKKLYLLLIPTLVLVIGIASASYWYSQNQAEPTPSPTPTADISVPTPVLTSNSTRASLSIMPEKTSYRAGETITLSVAPEGDAPVQAVLFIAQDFSQLVEDPPYTTTLTIPAGVGTLLVSAFARHKDVVETQEDISTLEKSLTIE